MRYHRRMEPHQPLEQPINPNPGDAQYVPQPLDSVPKPPGQRKTLWMIVACVVGLLLILGVAYWFMSKSAVDNYKQAAVTYRQDLTEVRDAMNNVLDEQNISARDVEAPPVFEEYGKKLQDVVTGAPTSPKVLGIIPVSGGQTKTEIDALTTAANSYAGQLRHIYELYVFYTATADAFTPIKNLGTFTVLDVNEIKALPGLWETFITEYKALPVPAGQEALRDELVRQAQTLLAEFQTLNSGFDQRTVPENDAIVVSLKEPTQALNQTFQTAAADSVNEAIDQVNTYYDELDKLLQ